MACCSMCFADHVKNNTIGSEEDDSIEKQTLLENKGRIPCPKKQEGCPCLFNKEYVLYKLTNDSLKSAVLYTEQWYEKHVQLQEKVSKQQGNSLEELREAYQANFPDARSCNKCKFGPMVHSHCSDMHAHSHESKNSCPRCGFHPKDWKELENWVKHGAMMPEETESHYQALLKKKKKTKKKPATIVELLPLSNAGSGVFMEVFIPKRDGTKVRGYLFVANNVLRVLHLHSGSVPEEEKKLFHAVVPACYDALLERSILAKHSKKRAAVQMYDWYKMVWAQFDMRDNSTARPLNDLESALVQTNTKDGRNILNFPHNIPVFDACNDKLRVLTFVNEGHVFELGTAHVCVPMESETASAFIQHAKDNSISKDFVSSEELTPPRIPTTTYRKKTKKMRQMCVSTRPYQTKRSTGAPVLQKKDLNTMWRDGSLDVHDNRSASKSGRYHALDVFRESCTPTRTSSSVKRSKFVLTNLGLVKQASERTSFDVRGCQKEDWKTLNNLSKPFRISNVKRGWADFAKQCEQVLKYPISHAIVCTSGNKQKYYLDEKTYDIWFRCIDITDKIVCFRAWTPEEIKRKTREMMLRRIRERREERTTLIQAAVSFKYLLTPSELCASYTPGNGTREAQWRAREAYEIEQCRNVTDYLRIQSRAERGYVHEYTPTHVMSELMRRQRTRRLKVQWARVHFESTMLSLKQIRIMTSEPSNLPGTLQRQERIEKKRAELYINTLSFDSARMLFIVPRPHPLHRERALGYTREELLGILGACQALRRRTYEQKRKRDEQKRKRDEQKRKRDEQREGSSASSSEKRLRLESSDFQPPLLFGGLDPILDWDSGLDLDEFTEQLDDDYFERIFSENLERDV